MHIHMQDPCTKAPNSAAPVGTHVYSLKIVLALQCRQRLSARVFLPPQAFLRPTQIVQVAVMLFSRTPGLCEMAF